MVWAASQSGKLGHDLFARVHEPLRGLILEWSSDWVPRMGGAVSKCVEDDKEMMNQAPVPFCKLDSMADAVVWLTSTFMVRWPLGKLL